MFIPLSIAPFDRLRVMGSKMTIPNVITNLLGLCVVMLLALVLLYLTRFWIFSDWWGNEGLWGVKALSRQGDFLARQLGGTPYQPFALVLWLAGGLLALSLLQAIAARIGGLFIKH